MEIPCFFRSFCAQKITYGACSYADKLLNRSISQRLFFIAPKISQGSSLSGFRQLDFKIRFLDVPPLAYPLPRCQPRLIMSPPRVSRKVTAPHKVQPLDSIAILKHNALKGVYTTELPIVFANHGFRYQMQGARQSQQGHAWRKFPRIPIEGHLDQCKTCIRDKGQKVNQALPKRWEAGTKPQYRESEDDPRLSPIIK